MINMKKMLAVIVLFVPMFVFAETIYVSGSVSGTWSADTVIVTAEIRIPRGQTLIIEPGVKVLFQGYYEFNVDSSATFQAIGLPTDSIIFTGFTDTTHWRGIRFNRASGSSRLEYCHITKALGDISATGLGGGIYTYNTIGMTIMHCRFDSCVASFGGAICINAWSDVVIAENVFTNNATVPNGGGENNGGAIRIQDSYFEIENNTFIGNTCSSAGSAGGAISLSSCEWGSIIGNYFSDNQASHGGAIRCHMGEGMLISNNVITQNIGGTYGGGIYLVSASDVIIVNNTITGNTVSGSGGGIYLSIYANDVIISDNEIGGNSAVNGGGIYCSTLNNPTITCNRIYGNVANQNGGGIYCTTAPRVIENTVYSNTAGQNGGGMYLSDISSSAQILNNLLYDNSGFNGGGIYTADIPLAREIRNCTITSNHATNQGGGCYSEGGTYDNCVLWSNTPDQFYPANTCSTTIVYSDIQGGWSGTGNINADPIFVNGPDGEYYLSQIGSGQPQQSPCVDAGDPTSQTVIGTTRTDGNRDCEIVDMGYHYDLSSDFKVTVTPMNPPIQISALGGSFSYRIQVTNEDTVSLTRNVWCELIKPNGSIVSPTYGPFNLTLPGNGSFVDTICSYMIYGTNPAGEYFWRAYAGIYPDSSWSGDGFSFIKLSGGTQISGNISGFLTVTNSPYIVTSSITVPAGQSLMIEPGVTLLFQTNTKLTVSTGARLHAIGTANDSITFKAYIVNTQWAGINFNNASDSSRLEYCYITGSLASGGMTQDINGGGIYCYHTDLTIKNCLIEHCAAQWMGGAICCDSSNALITANVVREDTAVYGAGIAFINQSGGSVVGNQIIENYAYPRTTGTTGSGGGIYCSSNSMPLIEGNSISNNYASGSGIGAGRGGGICCEGASPLILNNTISFNESAGANSGVGAGIYCEQANTLIKNNIIQGNIGHSWGAGIQCYSCAPTISHNIIYQNETYGSYRYGAGISCVSANPAINNNLIVENIHPHSHTFGGGIYLEQSSPMINNNIICGNQTDDYGAGICCNGASVPNIVNNIICENAATSIDQGRGGGVCCEWNSQATITGNQICKNTGADGMAAFYVLSSLPSLNKNVFYGNVNTDGTGAVISGLSSANATMVNSIVWANVPGQIGNFGPVTYTDVQNGFTGTGNINQYPQFVDTSLGDYRLIWESPCIDAGNPDSIYNDPDNTRADMGAYYYDQSRYVRVLLSPHEIPYLIPDSGGTMNYTIRATNIDSMAHTVTVWCDVTLPDSTTYGPVLGPVTITLNSGTTISRIRTQNVPGFAPMGVYHYNAYAIVDADTSKDSFMFGKLDTAMMAMQSEWTNTGESFEETAVAEYENGIPSIFSLSQNSPNPFKDHTTICYGLPGACNVKLSVYDITGRLVTCLVNGNQEPGVYQIPFMSTEFASGVYIYRLETDEFTSARKMIVLK